MPIAAARAGADLVLPIDEVGRALVDIVAGVRLPEPPPRNSDPTAVNGQLVDIGDVTAAQDEGLLPPWLTDGPNNAAARAEIARRRAAELRRRRQDLPSGLGATAETVARARHRAQESRRRAQSAHQAAEAAALRRGTDRSHH
jgi:two-component system, chemotaxis family, protein-glutamate methylesterase/glutaminase